LESLGDLGPDILRIRGTRTGFRRIRNMSPDRRGALPAKAAIRRIFGTAFRARDGHD